ncbi:hypothetical protein [Ancylobacter polymorphus]|uniref:Uncharacterized protein n=1 Tax=Ancylobacter polymorphus TaxID=223390 RepID=A0A9E7D8F8_9HYPH|nr:hypothetical protein [Ancylobacter polymorphus]UOK73581.1 hypothetical protein K9D25_23295 [Ancylobacter polymorphus]
MCIDCFDDSDAAGEDLGFAAGEIAWLARRIESDMKGAPLPARSWQIYFGEASGALDWPSLERIGRAMEGARQVAQLAGGPFHAADG